MNGNITRWQACNDLGRCNPPTNSGNTLVVRGGSSDRKRKRMEIMMEMMRRSEDDHDIVRCCWVNELSCDHFSFENTPTTGHLVHIRDVEAESFDGRLGDIALGSLKMQRGKHRFEFVIHASAHGLLCVGIAQPNWHSSSFARQRNAAGRRDEPPCLGDAWNFRLADGYIYNTHNLYDVGVMMQSSRAHRGVDRVGDQAATNSCSDSRHRRGQALVLQSTMRRRWRSGMASGARPAH